MHAAKPVASPSIDDAVVVMPKWLVPVSDPPIRDGYLVIGGGKILYLGSELPSRFASVRKVPLPRFAIIPGLVNAHCHLEFSDLPEPIPAGASFPDWIKRLIAFRVLQSKDASSLIESRKLAIEAGLRESYSHGVRWIVDMTTEPWDPAWSQTAFTSSSLRKPLFPTTVQPCIEMLDVTEQRSIQTQAFLQKQLHAPNLQGVTRCGLAPHASYTASSKLTEQLSELSQAESRLITMHLAESIDEMNWLHSQNGPFRDFLKGILQPSYFSTLGSIDDRLRSLRRGWRSLIAHANYLSEQQVRLVAENAQTMAIVHCPRTHAFFQHQHADGPTYPLAQRLAQGAVHFLGTDSRASNPDLNLWSEAQTLRAAHPSVPSHHILSMITCDAAAFLCIPDAEYGALRIASPAALTVIDLEPSYPSKSDFSSKGMKLPSDLTPDQLYDRILDRHTKSMPIEATIAASL